MMMLDMMLPDYSSLTQTSLVWVQARSRMNPSLQVVKQNVTGLLWILPATSGWWLDPYIQAPQYSVQVLWGWPSIMDVEIPGLKDFMLKMHPGNGHEDYIVSISLDFIAYVIVCLTWLNKFNSQEHNGHKHFLRYPLRTFV